MNLKDKAKDVDYYLQKNHGRSLWHFSLSLKLGHSEDLRDYPGDIEFIKKIGMNLEKQRDEILARYPKLPQNPKFLKKYPNAKPYEFPNLPPYMYWIYRDIEVSIRKINQTLDSQKLKGSPVKKINILALAWSHFIKSEKAENYDLILLLKWFGKKIKKMDKYRVFCEEVNSINGDQLRSLIYRHKNDDDYKEWGERYKIPFEMPGGGVAISFEDGPNNSLHESIQQKDDPLISFPDGDTLTIGDFEENSEMIIALNKK